jgi:cytochrome b561
MNTAQITGRISKTSNVKSKKQSVFQRLMSIHWVMALCYLVLFVTGTTLFSLGEDHLPQMLLDFHNSMGVLAIGLLTYRIFTLLQVSWQKYTKRLPKFSPKWFSTVALHTSLYLFMWTVPVTGVFLANTYASENIRFFGLLLPDLFPANEALVQSASDLHFWFAYTFLAFIMLHMMAQRKVVQANWRRFSNFVGDRFTFPKSTS